MQVIMITGHRRFIAGSTAHRVAISVQVYPYRLVSKIRYYHSPAGKMKNISAAQSRNTLNLIKIENIDGSIESRKFHVGVIPCQMSKIYFQMSTKVNGFP